MNIEPYVIDTVEELRGIFRRFRQEISVINFLIFDLYLNYISKKGIGAKIEEFEIYHRLMDGLKLDGQVASLQDIKVVLKNAAEYYGNPELNMMPLSFNEELMIEVLSNSKLNEFSSFLLSIEKNTTDGEFERYIDNILYAIKELNSRKDRNSFVFFDETAIKLVSSILNVNDTEVFSDIVSGYGLSTLKIVGTSKSQIQLSEISKDVAILSEMLFIVSEKRNYKISVEDTLFSNQIDKSNADKIFFDPPIRETAGKNEIVFDGISLRDSSVSAVIRATCALKENGIAVVAVPSSFLFGVNFSAQEARDYLLKNKLLAAVITLPPCWDYTTIPTNLVVLSKKENSEVVFVDLKNDKRFVQRNTLNDEAVSFILDAISGNMEENTFYSRKPFNEISKDSIIPIAYLKSDEQAYSQEIVSNKLDKLYGKLRELLG